MTGSCDQCVFYKASMWGETEYHVCRRYPPVTIDGDTRRVAFPVTTAHWWCGEFKQKEQGDGKAD